MAELGDILNGLFQSGQPAQETKSYNDLMGPILSSLASEFRDRTNPVNRIGDIGGALLTAVGSGEPYARTLAAQDTARRERTLGDIGVLEHLAKFGSLQEDVAKKEAWRTYVNTLPPEHPWRKFGAFMDPKDAVKELGAKPGEGMEFDPTTGKWRLNPEFAAYGLRKSQIGATNVSVKVGAEADALVANYEKYAKLAEANPGNQNYANMRDAFKRRIEVNDKQYPEYIVNKSTSMRNAYNLAEDLKKLTTDTSVFSTVDRAKLQQNFALLTSAMKDVQGYGGALTAGEQALVQVGLGGNPADLYNYVFAGGAEQARVRLDTLQSVLNKAHSALWDSYRRGPEDLTPSTMGRPNYRPPATSGTQPGSPPMNSRTPTGRPFSVRP